MQLQMRIIIEKTSIFFENEI